MRCLRSGWEHIISQPGHAFIPGWNWRVFLALHQAMSSQPFLSTKYKSVSSSPPLFGSIHDVVLWSPRTRVDTPPDADSTFLYPGLPSPPFFSLLRLPTMTDPSTGRAIVKAVGASLRLVSSSSELLTISQLYAVRDHLHEATQIVDSQVSSTENSKNIH